MRFAWSLVVVAACVEPPPVPADPKLCAVEAPRGTTPPPFEEAKFVAHAFGSPTGLLQAEIYTESREAFDASYFNGYRAYEIDLLLLADGTVAAVHDGYEGRYDLDRPFRDITRADLEGRKFDGKYEVLFAEQVVQIAVEHPDIWLILDTKCGIDSNCDAEIARTLVELAPDDSVRDRFVPHLTSDAHVVALQSIHPFPERLYARYQWPNTDFDVKRRMDEYAIDNVMMFWDSQWSESIQSTMDSAGYHVWVHTPEDPTQIEDFVARDIGTYTNGYITCPAE